MRRNRMDPQEDGQEGWVAVEDEGGQGLASPITPVRIPAPIQMARARWNETDTSTAVTLVCC